MPGRGRGQWRVLGDKPLVRVTPEGCWIWQRKVDNKYGRIYFQRKWYYAHRFVYQHFVGPIPAKHQIDHLCRERLCVNPAHLEAVTQRENILRSMAPNAVSVRTNKCYRGHEFTPESTMKHPGGRQCRICFMAAVRRRKMAASGKVA